MRRGGGRRGGFRGARRGGISRGGFRSGRRAGFRRARLARRRYWNPARRRIGYRGRWGRPSWRRPGWRRRGWWYGRGWRRGPWRRNWWGPGFLWWQRPIYINEPYWIDDRLRDETGRTYWKVFNGSNSTIRFSSYDGSVAELSPGESSRIWRGESFKYAIVTPNNNLLHEGATSKHYIMITNDGHSIATTNSKSEWRSWR